MRKYIISSEILKTQISVANGVQITSSPSDKSEMSIFVEADKVRIFQVISNLLCNAIKFTDKEGTISISLKKEKEQRVKTRRKGR